MQSPENTTENRNDPIERTNRLESISGPDISAHARVRDRLYNNHIFKPH